MTLFITTTLKRMDPHDSSDEEEDEDFVPDGVEDDSGEDEGVEEEGVKRKLDDSLEGNPSRKKHRKYVILKISISIFILFYYNISFVRINFKIWVNILTFITKSCNLKH